MAGGRHMDQKQPYLDKNLHAATQAEHQVERRLLLDVVVGQGAAVLKLLAGEDQALLVRRDAAAAKLDYLTKKCCKNSRGAETTRKAASGEADNSRAEIVARSPLLVLDLRLHVLDGVAGLDLERNRLAGQGLQTTALVTERTRLRNGGTPSETTRRNEGRTAEHQARNQCSGIVP